MRPIDEGRIISLIEGLTERLRETEAASGVLTKLFERLRESRITALERCWGAGQLGPRTFYRLIIEGPDGVPELEALCKCGDYYLQDP